MRRAALAATTSISTSPAGLRIQEPAADLAAAAALVSSLANAPLPADAVYFGEVSLSGAVRPVAQTAARLKEAQKLGFARAIVPEAARAEAADPAASRSTASARLVEPGRRHRRAAAKSRAQIGPRNRRQKTGDARRDGPLYTRAACRPVPAVEAQPQKRHKIKPLGRLSEALAGAGPGK